MNIHHTDTRYWFSSLIFRRKIRRRVAYTRCAKLEGHAPRVSPESRVTRVFRPYSPLFFC